MHTQTNGKLVSEILNVHPESMLSYESKLQAMRELAEVRLKWVDSMILDYYERHIGEDRILGIDLSKAPYLRFLLNFQGKQSKILLG